MKRIVTSLAAGAIGLLLMVPCVNAQSWGDISNDNAAIHAKHEQIHHDKAEQREDLRNGNYQGAEHEQAEINHRREAAHERQQDLNNDLNNGTAQQYYGNDEASEYNDEHHAWRHNHHHDQDHHDHDRDNDQR